MRKQIPLLLFFCLNVFFLSAQWTTSGSNIYYSTGNVGIGTTLPGANLHVHGTTSLGDGYDPIFYGLAQIVRPASPLDNKFHLSFIRNGSSISGMGYVPNTNTFGIWHAGSNAGTPAIAILPDQKVGIGYSTPSTPLHVHNAYNADNTVGATSELATFSGSVGNYGQFKFLFRRHELNQGWTGFSSRLQAVTDITYQGYLEFNPPGEPYGVAIGTLGTELMRFKMNGDVKMGGPAGSFAKFQMGDRFTIQDGGWKAIHYNALWDNGLNNNARIEAAPTASIFFTDLGNVIFQTAPTGVAGSAITNGIHGFIIHNSGQVGIGTSGAKSSFTDQAYRLFVEGGIRARKVKVDQITPWPDYVFDSSYQLLTLAEVERFIQTNKHLPEIPSAKEVEKEGLDLGDNQAALLKKIEELTLHLIAQDKKLQQQEKRMEEQDKRQNELQREVEELKKLVSKPSTR